MGTVKKGILGDFSGKVGSVVGSNWKGIGYIRSLPKKVGNPRTLPQKSHRAKFRFMAVANSVYVGGITVEDLRSVRNDDVISINPKR